MRYLFLSFILIISILILRLNFKLQSENYTTSEKKADIVFQLNFLESELKNNNLGERMQQLYPEGYIFINALYGLSWCELALSYSQNDSILKNKAISKALYAYNEINSDIAKWTFDSGLMPENGIFYSGWRNYLLSKILSVDTTFQKHDIYINAFKLQCDSIIKALKISDSPYLQSYKFQSWPADMFVAMASVSNYDKIFYPKYESEINTWIQDVKERLDPATHMIPHKVDSETSKSIQGTRGCSMGLILRMLAEINPDFAHEQFNLFKANHISTTFGLPSVREFPESQHGTGDIDSGPVIFGVGFSGTIVSIGTFAMLDCEYLADKQYKTVNAFGFGKVTGNQKRYLFGKLPLADAFISWGRATGLNYENSSNYQPEMWRVEFHTLSLLIIMVLWLPFYYKKIRRKKAGI